MNQWVTLNKASSHLKVAIRTEHISAIEPQEDCTIITLIGGNMLVVKEIIDVSRMHLIGKQPESWTEEPG